MKKYEDGIAGSVRKSAAMIGAAALLLLAAKGSAQLQYQYTALNVPGLTFVEAAGVDQNKVVGTGLDASGHFEGFEHTGSGYSFLKAPGAANTFASGVSGNTIVGSYDSNSVTGLVQRGYEYNGSTYTSFMVPGATSTGALGVSGNEIVGRCAFNNSTSESGFFYDGSKYTILNVPGATSTFATGVSGNVVVGFYQTASSGPHVFEYSGGNYTTLNPPGTTQTAGAGISGNVIVGSGNNGEIFLDNGGSYSFIAGPPGSDAIFASGISGTTIVGYYDIGSGSPIPFVATPVPEASIFGVAAGGCGLLLCAGLGLRKRFVG